MRKYITIWLVILLVVDLAAFGYMARTGGRFIMRNKEYVKAVFFGHEGWNIEVYDAIIFDDYMVDEYIYERIEGDPISVGNEKYSLFEVEVREDDGDLKYFFEILGIIDIVLVGVAVILYIVFSNIHARPGVSIGFAILFVAFLVGAAYVGHLYHQYISTPGEIYDYYDMPSEVYRKHKLEG